MPAELKILREPTEVITRQIEKLYARSDFWKSYASTVILRESENLTRRIWNCTRGIGDSTRANLKLYAEILHEHWNLMRSQRSYARGLYLTRWLWISMQTDLDRTQIQRSGHLESEKLGAPIENYLEIERKGVEIRNWCLKSNGSKKRISKSALCVLSRRLEEGEEACFWAWALIVTFGPFSLGPWYFLIRLSSFPSWARLRSLGLCSTSGPN